MARSRAAVGPTGIRKPGCGNRASVCRGRAGLPSLATFLTRRQTGHVRRGAGIPPSLAGRSNALAIRNPLLLKTLSGRPPRAAWATFFGGREQFP